MNPAFNATLNYSSLDIPTQSVHFSQILQDFCVQIHEKVVLCAILILAYFLINTIILPRARLGFEWLIKEKPFLKPFHDNITWLFDRLESLLETFGLGCSLFLIFIVYYQQGLTTFQWVIIAIMALFAVLALISKVVGWLRNRRAKT